MKTILDTTTETLEIKQSKFIAFLMPYSDFEATLSGLKEDHPKARHFVTAFRYLNAYDQIVEGSSDDGEPKGTSGKPTLAVLAGGDMINVAVITVRYFGGTRLGTGGLVRAYSDVTNILLEKSELQNYVKLEEFSFICKYNDLRQVEYELEQLGIRGVEKMFESLHVSVRLACTADEYEAFVERTKRLIDSL